MKKEVWKKYTKTDEGFEITIKETNKISHISATACLEMPEKYLRTVEKILDCTVNDKEDGTFISFNEKDSGKLTIYCACLTENKYEKIEELISMLDSYKNMMIVLAMEGQKYEQK